jgi:general secretion pathway protein J
MDSLAEAPVRSSGAEVAVRRRGPVRLGRSAGSAGFTLIELLIALAMVGLITLLLFSALRIGTRAWDSVDLVSERTGALRLTRDFLQQALTQARGVTLIFDGNPVWVFGGDRERIEFVTPLAERVGLPGLYILRLALEDTGESNDLILTRWLIHPEVLEGMDDVPAWEPLVETTGPGPTSTPLDRDLAAGAYGRTRLLEGVETFQIHYFGVLDGESEAAWHSEWLNQHTLPMLVRIGLMPLGQSWPDLIVALPGAQQ